MTTPVAHHVLLPCGWCGTSNQDVSLTNCINCGGPLPPSPVLALDDPGAPPPPVPRTIPNTYRWKVLLWNNVMATIGIFFTVFFCWTILFALIGIPMWYFSWRRAFGKLEALQNGVPAQARLEEVFRDGSVKSNGRSPWKLVYTFTTANGAVHEGWTHSWQAHHSRRQSGEAFWVVHMRDDPGQNAVWPPVS
ncbi:MAG: hypothetical protein AAFV53_24370 [Myxococcota bacterium]